MKTEKKDFVISLLFIAPAAILITVFIAIPIIYNILLSFHNWSGMYGTPWEFVGFKNYTKILNNSDFWKALLNSGYFIIGGFCILMPLSFCLALLITSKLRFTGIMKTAYFTPVMLGTTAVALMWVSIFNPNYGAIADILKFLGKEEWIKDWLATPTVNLWCVILVNEWMYAGYNMLIFAAGLVSIPNTILEAGTIDGCTGIQKIRYIILPLCKNSFKIFSVLCITGCLKVFDIVWAMTAGGPNNVSTTPGVLLYTEAFKFRNYGRSSVIGVLLVLLGAVLSLLLNRIFRQDNMYEEGGRK